MSYVNSSSSLIQCNLLFSAWLQWLFLLLESNKLEQIKELNRTNFLHHEFDLCCYSYCNLSQQAETSFFFCLHLYEQIKETVIKHFLSSSSVLVSSTSLSHWFTATTGFECNADKHIDSLVILTAVDSVWLFLPLLQETGANRWWCQRAAMKL